MGPISTWPATRGAPSPQRRRSSRARSVVAELVDADSEVLRTAVVGDGELHHPDVTLSSDLTQFEAGIRRVLAAPLTKALDPLEPFARLRELEYGVIAVDRVGPLGIAPRTLEVLLEHRPDRSRVHPPRFACERLPQLAGQVDHQLRHGLPDLIEHRRVELVQGVLRP